MENNMSDVCFFCTTPFQIMSVIGIQEENWFKADLYIDPLFEGAAVYAERIRELGMFEKVVVIDDIRLKRIRNQRNRLLKTIDLLQLYYGNFARRTLKEKVYRQLFTSSNALVYAVVDFYYKRIGAKCETIYFDDGEGTYDNFEKVYSRIKREKSSKKVQLYLYSPELFNQCYPHNYLNLIKIKRWTDSSSVLASIDHIFGEKNDISISERLLILDTIKCESLNDKDSNKLSSIYRRIAEKCSYDNTVIKKHPRDKTYEDEFKYYLYDSIPFEYIALKSNIERKVLISLSSSATIMPKLILDQEPIVLLLYKLFDIKIGKSIKRDIMYRNCKLLYRNPRKFIIPSNAQELDSAMNIIHRYISEENEDVLNDIGGHK